MKRNGENTASQVKNQRTFPPLHHLHIEKIGMVGVIGLEQESPPHRKLSVRQVSGLFARRIVCQLRSGEVLKRGEKFGMIKLGSRTELILPADGLQLEVEVGQKVRAGSTVIGRYAETRPS